MVLCGRDFDNPDLTLEQLFDRWPELASVFFRHNMLCVGCWVASFHTLSDACDAYDLDIKAFRSQLKATATGAIDDAGVIPPRQSEQGDGRP